MQGYHEKEEFKLRKDYETKSSFRLPSCKAEYKATYRDKGLHLNFKFLSANRLTLPSPYR